MTNRQRFDVLLLMAEMDIVGDHRVSGVPELIYGTTVEKVGDARPLDVEETSTRIAPASDLHRQDKPYIATMSGVPLRSVPVEREHIIDRLASASVDTAPLSRAAFRRSALRHRSIVAPPGYGELSSGTERR